VTLLLALVGGDLIDEVEDLPGVIAWLFNPLGLATGIFALAIVLRGIKSAPQDPVPTESPQDSTATTVGSSTA
jgi:hypothetical protein